MEARVLLITYFLFQISLEAQESHPSPIRPGKFVPTWESPQQSNPVPEWFKDAKFGIYFRWGVYSVPAFTNEWYLPIIKNKSSKPTLEFTKESNTLLRQTELGLGINKSLANHSSLGNREPLPFNAIIDSDYQLDSVIFHALHDTIRYSYEYNSNGKMIGILRKKWVNNEWSNQYQDIIGRNWNGNRDTVISQEWKDNKWVNTGRRYNIYNSNETIIIYEKWEEEHWQKEQRTTYSYDDNRYLVIQFYEDWVSDHWEASLRETFEYDSRGNLTIFIIQQWNEGELGQSIRTTCSYDSLGNNTAILYEDWRGSEWVKRERLSYFYNAIGKDTLYLKERWLQSRQVWVNGFRWMTAYDSSGNRIESTEETWRDNKWESMWRTIWQHDSYGNVIDRIDQHRYLNQWANASHRVYVYDEDRNLTGELSEQWNGSRWVGDYRIAYSFNSNGNLISYLYESWNGQEWIKGPYGQYSFYFEGWLFQYPGYWVELHYSTITEVSNAKSPELYFNLSQNYPNPFNPLTRIKYELPKQSEVRLIIYNVLGEEVAELVNAFQKAGRYEVQWDAERFASGVYMCQLKADDFISSKKLLLLE